MKRMTQVGPAHECVSTFPCDLDTCSNNFRYLINEFVIGIACSIHHKNKHERTALAEMSVII